MRKRWVSVHTSAVRRLALNVVYDCHIPEVMGYPEQGYCFRRGDEVLLMWSGYFNDLMQAMWTVYGWLPDAMDAESPNLDQVPFLRQWNEQGEIGPEPLLITEVAVRAFSAAVAELKRVGSNLPDSARHGEALVGFL